jgi:hypothetical protein
VIVHRARSTQQPIRSQEADRRCPLHGVICSAGLSGNKTESHTIVGNVFSPCRLENTKAVIKNGQSRETVNIGYTRPIIRKWIAAPSLHIFLIAVKRRDLGGISPVFIMVKHINKFPHPSCVDVHLVKPKVNIYQTKITLATFVYHVYVLLLHTPKDV